MPRHRQIETSEVVLCATFLWWCDNCNTHKLPSYGGVVRVYCSVPLLPIRPRQSRFGCCIVCPQGLGWHGDRISDLELDRMSEAQLKPR